MASILNAGQQGLNFSRSSTSTPLIRSDSAIGKVLSILDLTRVPSLQEADRTTVVFSVLAVVASLLLFEQYNYQKKKAGLPGPKWTIPIIGKFADSLSPSLEKYQEGWNSGPLSVASVFNIFIVIASSNEYARKILNSPTYAEPCLVASAKKVLCPDNWYVHY